uniref:Uncharacterized protein n=1 Tax=Rhizophora mucronata TaxID=61149 RepID=A0A2P2QC18_RHIMU
MSLHVTVRLIYCNLEVIGLSCRNSIFVKSRVSLRTFNHTFDPTAWELCALGHFFFSI